VEPTDEPRQGFAGDGDLGRVTLALAAGLFVSLYLPWVETISGWALRVGEEAGLIALALILVELLRLMGSWTSRGAQLLGVCLTPAAGIMSVTTFVTLRWGSGGPLAFSALKYGAWLGFALGILLVVVAVVQLSTARQSSS
jgi:hypothetical protein